jgi:hypothetical protein
MDMLPIILIPIGIAVAIAVCAGLPAWCGAKTYVRYCSLREEYLAAKGLPPHQPMSVGATYPELFRKTFRWWVFGVIAFKLLDRIGFSVGACNGYFQASLYFAMTAAIAALAVYCFWKASRKLKTLFAGPSVRLSLALVPLASGLLWLLLGYIAALAFVGQVLP